MPEDARPPVAIRITRPYTTEDEFLEQELESLSRTSVTLLGAQPRPQGVVLRFELVLSSGHVLMRGEGRVVGFRPNAHQGLGGLTLRFTRLDSRSKSLVDKAAQLRERRRPSASPAPHDAATPFAPATSEAPRAQLSSEPEVTLDVPLDLEATHAEAPLSKRSEGAPPPLPPRPTSARAGATPPARPTHAPAASAAIAPAAKVDLDVPSPAREELLARLRSRGKALEPADVQRILEQRQRRS